MKYGHYSFILHHMFLENKMKKKKNSLDHRNTGDLMIAHK
jgi:hypothetical protein